VPICYVYDGGCVYAHTVDGMKRHAMQTNPQVCFEELIPVLDCQPRRRGTFGHSSW
jgi:hypothetical protein